MHTCCTCKHIDASFSSYPCHSCDDNDKWEPLEEQKECETCRYSGNKGCTMLNPCFNFDKYEPMDEPYKVLRDPTGKEPDIILEPAPEYNTGIPSTDGPIVYIPGPVKDSPSKTQVGGSHYKDMAIQPAEFCEKNHLDWCASNVIKYVVRCKSKGGIEDLRKAKHYLELMTEWNYPGESL